MNDICPGCGNLIDENDELILCPYCSDVELCNECLTAHYEEDCKEFPGYEHYNIIKKFKDMRDDI